MLFCDRVRCLDDIQTGYIGGACVKLRNGLVECASFIVSAPCSGFCLLLGCALLAFERLVAEGKRMAKSVTIWALQNLAWVAIVEVCHSLFG